MTRGFAFLAILMLVATGSALAVAPGTLLDNEVLLPGQTINDVPKATLSGARSDTIWFGGDDGTGMAFENGIWDWDTIVEDPFQGWTNVDITANWDLYFYRVIADDFSSHGDGCTPIFTTPGNVGEIWCGIHEDEADLRDFVSGMGYANDLCQKAFAPTYNYVDGAGIDLGFIYFQDSEPGFDYTYVYINMYDGDGNPTTPERIQAAKFDGRIGAYDDAATFSGDWTDEELPSNLATYQIEFRFDADGGWSDQDGSWATECGPFAADDIEIVGTTYDFNSGEQGFTFEMCPGIGAFMDVHPQSEWTIWMDAAGLACGCPMSNNVLGFATDDVPYDQPGHPEDHNEAGISGIVERGGYTGPNYDATIARDDAFWYMRKGTGGHYKPNWQYYPFTSESNPTPHWSPRMGQNTYWYTGETPRCVNNVIEDLSHPYDGDPIPTTWTKMKFVYEVLASCTSFSIPPSACLYEGETFGSPLIDNVQVGLTSGGGAPGLTLETGSNFHDGFGMRFPTFLEPGDVGNSNTTYDLSRDDTAKNDWLADTAIVKGPLVPEDDPEPYRWLVQMCLKVTRKGPRQDMTPGYQEWKARFTGDPEQDYVCALMDSAQVPQGTYHNKFVTYFHETDYGFDHANPDYTTAQEILPDSMFVPGTRIDYYWQGYWYNGGAPPSSYYTLGPYEFETLPNMRLAGRPEEYDVIWPCVLYIDAFNRGAENYIAPLLDQQFNGEWDKFDRFDTGSNWDAAMKRSFGGTYYNPGSWGNNGCTVDQLLGYRLIVLNTGTLGAACLEVGDVELLELWLTSTQCGLADTRRGLVLNGDLIGKIVGDPLEGVGQDFMNNVLGATYEALCYRLENDDDAYCAGLEPSASAVFTPADPGVRLYGNGCPNIYNYNVLGIQPGVANVTGNLRYYCYLGGCASSYVDYAQVVRENIEDQVANWKTVVDGFSLHHLSEKNCAGEDCSVDSSCIVDGAADVFGPELLWIEDPADQFLPWIYPCTDDAVDEDSEGHLSGPVNYLYQSSPNPFRSSATIRFKLANAGDARLTIFDVSGRVVKTLINGMVKPSENGSVEVTWDGTNNAGERVGGGIYWMQLSTHDGYVSAKKMIGIR